MEQEEFDNKINQLITRLGSYVKEKVPGGEFKILERNKVLVKLRLASPHFGDDVFYVWKGKDDMVYWGKAKENADTGKSKEEEIKEAFKRAFY